MSMYKVSLSMDTSSSSRDQSINHISSVSYQNISSASYLESTEADRDAAWTTPSSVKVSDMRYLFDDTVNEKVPDKQNRLSFIDKEIDELRAREAEWKQLHTVQQSLTPTPLTLDQPQAMAPTYPTATSDAPIDFDDVRTYSTPKPALLAQGSPDSGYQDSSDVTVKNGTVKRMVTFNEPNFDNRPENPKEKLILDEIEEQKKREEELRRHWKDLGFDITVNKYLDDLEVEDDEDTPEVKSNKTTEVIVRTEPDIRVESKLAVESKTDAKLVPPTLSYGAQLKSLTTGAAKSEIKKETTTLVLKSEITKPQPKEESSKILSNGGSLNDWNELAVFSNKTYVPESTPPKPVEKPMSVEPTRRALSVQPFTDDEDDDTNGEARFWMAPQTETFIQREIKAAREREEALRIARGLPALVKTDHTDNSVVTIEVSKSSRPVSVSVDHRDAMKIYAESRLQVELKKEKEKELALLRQGSIHTLSEERIGEPAKFIEIITPETEKLLQERAQERALKKKQEKENQEREKFLASEAKQAILYNSRDSTDGGLDKSDKEIKIEVAGSTLAEKSEKSGTKLEANISQKSPTLSSSPMRWTTSRTTPKVFLTYSYDPNSKVQSHEALTKAAAGALLKQEAEEANRREDELRQMRAALKEELQHISLTFPLASATSPKPKPAFPLTPAAVFNYTTPPVNASMSHEDDHVTFQSNASTPPTAQLSAAAEASPFGTAPTVNKTLDQGVVIEKSKKDKPEGQKDKFEGQEGAIKIDAYLIEADIKVSEKAKVKEEDSAKKGPKIVEVEMRKDVDDMINEQTPQAGDELIAAERKRQRLALIREWEMKSIYGTTTAS